MNDRPNLSIALEHYKAGRLLEAERFLFKVSNSEPEYSYALLMLGLISADRGDPTGALRHLEQAAVRLPDFAPAQLNLGDARCQTKQFSGAVESYRRALAISPGSAETLTKLGDTLMTLGQVEEAIECLRRAVDLNPTLIRAQCSLAAAGQSDVEASLQRLFELPEQPEPDKVAVGFALATLLDRAGAWDEAFAHLDEVNALVRARLVASNRGFDANALGSYVEQRILACTSHFFKATPHLGNASELPVFVVGMPRSGTTLVEQILASHSKVHGLGESNAIGAIDSELSRSAVSDCYGHWEAATGRRQADLHVEWLRSTGGGAHRVVDKTPDNLFHLGLIARLFPNSRVIMCTRDLRDVCLSCYFQLFAEPMPYAYDLADCTTRALAVERLMSHWSRVLPLRICTVRYETLVANPETESRRIIDFLDLPWEEACLESHRTERAVLTASVWQVRQPIYSRSVGRWQNYSKHLGSMLNLLGREQGSV